MSATMTGAEEVAWDLSDLYESPDDPAFEHDLEAHARARARVPRALPRPDRRAERQQLAEALEELDEIEGAHVRPAVFAHLLFATDTADPSRGALLQRAQEWSAGLEKDLLFAQLEWAAVPDERAEELFADPALERWSHFLRALRRFRPHLLSEPEETILTEKSVSGQAAWGRLFNELTSAAERVARRRRGLLRAGARADVLAGPRRATHRRRSSHGGPAAGHAHPCLRLQHPPARQVHRRPAAQLPALGRRAEPVQRDLRRGGDALVEAVVSRYDIPQRYYRLKARLLGLATGWPTTTAWRRSRPTSPRCPGTRPATWCSRRTTSSSDEAGGIVSDFFERSWIDAPVRPNKRNGAFCVTRVPGVHPYVLMNFTGDRRSVLTLAHELGHGLHGALAQRKARSTPRRR